MSITPKDIAWGSYTEYEGPYFRGVISYRMPDDPSEDDRRLRVLVSTEGAAYDAVNMYDRCVVSVGLIQWCEGRYFLVSKLLHAIAEKLGPDAITGPLKTALQISCAEFKKNPLGQWRFHFKDTRGEVNTLEKQQQLFLGCDGKKGSWTVTSRMKARAWAAGMANIWNNPEAQKIQATYTQARMTAFLMKEARDLLWDGRSDEGWGGALRAAYLSFAGNLPAVANKHVQIAATRSGAEKWSQDWCTTILQELTFGPGIAIYPHRYDKIRPRLEELWPGVKLPKTASDLKIWKEQEGVSITLPEPIKPETHDVVKIEPSKNTRDAVVLDRPAVEEPAILVPRPPESSTGIMGWILYVFNLLLNIFLKKKA